jgi:hypothetical protein
VQIIRRKPETRRVTRIIYIMGRNLDDSREKKKKKKERRKKKEEKGVKNERNQTIYCDRKGGIGTTMNTKKINRNDEKRKRKDKMAKL